MKYSVGVFVVVLLQVAYGYGEKRQPVKERRATELEKPIADMLDPKPASVQARVTSIEAVNPLDTVLITSDYDGAHSLGYEGLRFYADFNSGRNQTTRARITATRREDGEQVKIAQITYDDDGHTVRSRTYEEDKEKLAAVVARCGEIEAVLRKLIPKEPAPRK